MGLLAIFLQASRSRAATLGWGLERLKTIVVLFPVLVPGSDVTWKLFVLHCSFLAILGSFWVPLSVGLFGDAAVLHGTEMCFPQDALN